MANAKIQRFLTGALATLALVLVAYVLLLLGAAAYSNFVDGYPRWGVVCLGLAAVPFVVVAETYRRGRTRSLSATGHARNISLALLVVGAGLAFVVAVLSAPF